MTTVADVLANTLEIADVKRIYGNNGQRHDRLLDRS